MRPPRRFAVLWRAFFAQFFTSDHVGADIQLRQTIIGVLAFLLVPGIILLVQIFFDYQGIVARTLAHRRDADLDGTLEWIVFVFTTYSAVTVGFVAVFVWDALVFDQRDAMVLGPLPLRGTTLVSAKLSALAAFLVGTALLVNLPNAFMFAFETANSLALSALFLHFFGFLAATVLMAVFVFTALVSIRGVLPLLFGARTAAACGSLLQFVFVVALLTFVILCPAVWRVPHRALVNPTVTGWLPPSWFVGVFERVRGSTVAYFMPQATRAFVATSIAVASAIVVSIAAFRRQMQLTLAPAAGVRGAAAVRAVRWIARRLVGADPAAAAAADFILVTMARSRAQQTPIAMNAAIGVAMVVASLVQLRDPGTPAHPASALLSIPLMLAFWAVVGFRAACFVPADAPASWTFRVNAPDMARSGWLAVRASMIALIVPPIVVAAALLALILDWRLALWHVAVTTGLTVALIEIAAPTIRFLPFTRPYVHGHARLRTRWPMYLFGMFVFSRAPAHTDVLLTHPAALATVCTALTIAIGALELAGRCRPRAWPPQSDDDDVNPDVFRIKVLDLGYGVD